MPRTALSAEKIDDIKIDQKSSIADLANREGEIVRAEQMPDKDYMDELAFNEEPVTIRLEPNTDKNAATVFPIWVNGKGCEVFENGRWHEIAYLPVSRILTIKRKYLAVLIGAKIDSVNTVHAEQGGDDGYIRNDTRTVTAAVHSFSVIEDRNPRGAIWLQELRRRYF